MGRTLLFAAVAAAVLMCSCTATQTAKSQRYDRMYEEKPLSVLVMPPINRTTNVAAKELFYSSLVVPLTMRGYYVMPPMLTMEILKEESAYDAEMFANSSMNRVGGVFGVDAVLFTTIHEWEKTALLGQVRVVVEYTLKSTATDEVLFNRKGTVTYSPNADTGNALANILSNMVSTALTKEIELGRKCNAYAIEDIPAGKYSPEWGKDGDEPAADQTFSIKL